ncbi:hypothetical protein BN132_2459 [Cronobacter turicensis 564]|nr:hypothetical protein BN132_2459 [Cronobacter turicensis 564]
MATSETVDVVFIINDFTPIDQLGTIKFGVQPVRLTNRNITAGMLGAAVTVEIERL